MKQCYRSSLLLLIIIMFTAVPALCDGTLILPESLTKIGANAITDCGQVTKLVFQGGEIGFEASVFPETVEEVVFGSGVTNIKASFKGWENLKRLVFQGMNTVVEDGAFQACPMKTVVLAPFNGPVASSLIDGEHFIAPSCNALLIGQLYEGAVDGAGKSAELHGCIEDAHSLERMLLEGKAEKDVEDAVQIIEYSDVNAYTEQSSAQILSRIEALVKPDSTDDDVSLFYYSGHGMDGGYLVGYNQATRNLQPLSPSDLYAKLKNVPGKKIVIVDACYSGGLIGRGNVEESFVEDFLSAFDMCSRSGELAEEDFFVIVSASVKDDGSHLSVSIRNGTIYYGLFTRFFAEAFGWDRLVSPESGYGSWQDASSLDMPADVGPWLWSDHDGCVTLKEAYLYAKKKVEAFETEWNSSHTDIIDQVTRCWPYFDEDSQTWPETTKIVLYGWAQGMGETGE